MKSHEIDAHRDEPTRGAEWLWLLTNQNKWLREIAFQFATFNDILSADVRIDIHHHSGDSQAILERLDGLDQKLNQILQKENEQMKELDDLAAQVKANTTVIGSAKDLIVGLKDKLDAAIAAGPAALKALSDELKAQDDALAAAVVANTPADTGGTPTP